MNVYELINQNNQKNHTKKRAATRNLYLKMATKSSSSISSILANSWKQKQQLSLLSFNRTLATSPASSSNADTATTTTTVTKSSSKRKKKKNLFEVAQFLPNWGIGYQMAKTHWSGVAYQITKINLYKDGKHGKAWGIVHKDGVPAADAPKKISGVHKRCWKYIPNSKITEQSTPQPLSEPEAQST